MHDTDHVTNMVDCKVEKRQLCVIHLLIGAPLCGHEVVINRCHQTSELFRITLGWAVLQKLRDIFKANIVTGKNHGFTKTMEQKP